MPKIQGGGRGSFFSFSFKSTYSNTICLKDSFLHWIASVALSKISWIYLCEPVSGFSIVSSICVSVHQYQTVLITELSSKLKHQEGIPATWFIFLKFVLRLVGPLPFHTNFRISFYLYQQKIFPGFCQLLHYTYRSIWGASVSLLCYVFQWVNMVSPVILIFDFIYQHFMIFNIQILHSFKRFISKYFVFFGATVDDVVFVI